jgi:D-beta-D-heptose 7-phosphate kinase/D-beta-D-heptose 1-phosphate adenosyltransferase
MLERLRDLLAHPPRLWVIGDVMLDRYLVGSVDRVSPEAPVPVLLHRSTEDRLGGAANVAVNLGALGGLAALGGVLGSDEPGDCVLTLLQQAGVRTGGVLRPARAVTTTKQRAVCGSQQLLRIDSEQRIQLTGAEVDAILDGLWSELPEPSVILVSDYAKGVISREFMQRLFLRVGTIPVFVDPKGRDYSPYVGAAVITPNEREAALAAGVEIRDEASLREAAARLHRQLPGTAVLITQGAHGMTLLTEGGAPPLHSPAQARRVFDVTGAGDTALATLAMMRAFGLDWPDALHVANVAAGIAVSKIGTSPVYRSELLSALSREETCVKLIERSGLAELRRTTAELGQRLVFTNGCFDILHVGHLQVLERARQLGDVLIVAVNSDASVQRLKGDSRPINVQEERAAMLAGLSCVDFVTIFEEDTPLAAILACQPDVLVKGGDYSEATIVGAPEVRAAGGRVEVVPIVQGRSTTRVLERAAAFTREQKAS